MATKLDLIENYMDDLFVNGDDVNSLRETILQLAVQGELVEQNPEDEPASELLKRITEEKERLVKEGKIKITFHQNILEYYVRVRNRGPEHNRGGHCAGCIIVHEIVFWVKPEKSPIRNRCDGGR